MLGLFAAADGHRGSGRAAASIRYRRSSRRVVSGFIDADQPPQSVVTSPALLAGFVGANGAVIRIGNAADAAVLADRLRWAPQSVVLALGHAIGEIAGGEIRIGHAGHAI